MCERVCMRAYVRVYVFDWHVRVRVFVYVSDCEPSLCTRQ